MYSSRKKSELDIIYHVSHTVLNNKSDISTLLKNILKVLQTDLELQRCVLTLKRKNKLTIEASKGLTVSEKESGEYSLGEGITGKVGKNGRPVIIPDISKETNFIHILNKADNTQKTAFICIPIKHSNKTVGTLSVDIFQKNDLNLDNTKRLLETVGNIIADGVAKLRNEIKEKEQLKSENLRLKNELGVKYHPDNIIGNCNNMRFVYAMIAQVANSLATVLIRGESGTGKELVAKAIHYCSPRTNKPFIAVNCAALPESLIETELFGHERGAFTGAETRRKGRFELAEGGTIFLDEIGDISIPVQVKLLRVLQERTFERVGGNTSLKANVRIIAATSTNLEQALKDEKFREDLYYRLNVFPINVPPLRQRKSDIILLANHFLNKYSKQYNKNIRRISTPAINMLMTYHWPGNVRELENCIESAVLMTANNVINAYNLPPSLQTAQESRTSNIEDKNLDFKTIVKGFEKEIIVEALKKTNGNVAAAARLLKTTKRILHYKTENLSIDLNKFSV
ncbi:MAG: sigma 54-interacting transcriptional regulator [Victivallales bacterium]|nr:sigma 54-interacting transcriptional regulator [Victivallales bacterium]